MKNKIDENKIPQKFDFIDKDNNMSLYDFFPKGKAWLIDKDGNCLAMLLLDLKGSSRNSWSFTENVFNFGLILKIDGYRLNDCLNLDKAMKATKNIVMSPSNGQLIKYSSLSKVFLVKPILRRKNIGKLVTEFSSKKVINNDNSVVKCGNEITYRGENGRENVQYVTTK